MELARAVDPAGWGFDSKRVLPLAIAGRLPLDHVGGNAQLIGRAVLLNQGLRRIKRLDVLERDGVHLLLSKSRSADYADGAD